MTEDQVTVEQLLIERDLRAKIERLTMLHDNAKHWEAQWLADNERLTGEIKGMQSLLFRLRNYIAGERTSDRPKDAMLELIDAALEPKP